MATNNNEHEKEVFQITVNGVGMIWEHKKISYEQIIKLAFPNGPTGGDVRYSVTWTMPDGEEGSLNQGDHVDVVQNMTFDVRNTDKS